MHTCWRYNGKLANVLRSCGRWQQRKDCGHHVQTTAHKLNAAQVIWQSSRCHTPSSKAQRRHASTSTTATSLKGQRIIPLANRSLYQALKEVQHKAAAHINLSRLQLALQGLESAEPATRLAILGLNNDQAVRELIRLLLADPLEDEQAWERQILEQEAANGFIIRYGPTQNTNVPHRSALPILTVPSPVLQKLNVELLVAGVNQQHSISGGQVPVETYLAPAVGVPTSFDGRSVTVNQPVHAALLLSNGVDQLVSSIRLVAKTSFDSSQDEALVGLAANIPDLEAPSGQHIYICDLEKASHGLAAIRGSVSNAASYGRDWVASGVPQLSEWMHDNAVPATNILKLTESLLTSANASVREALLATSSSAKFNNGDLVWTFQMEAVIDRFSRSAHRELQAGLASAWASPSWSKLAWYKLFWRIDDVGLITSDLVANTWLRDTEKAAYEICGRFLQLGINPIMPITDQIETKVKTNATALSAEEQESVALDVQVEWTISSPQAPGHGFPPIVSSVEDTQKMGSVTTIRPASLAGSISLARQDYIVRQVDSLSSTAQQLLFRTLSISGLSGGLSGLLYASGIAPTAFEAGSLFALGTVIALWRLQSGWQSATRAMEKSLFEEGRDVIRHVIAQMRHLVAAKAKAPAAETNVETQLLLEAERAISQAKEAVDTLSSARKAAG